MSSPAAPSKTYATELERLQAIEKEYRIMLRVVAVLTDLVTRGKGTIAISDAQLLKAPEMQAWHDDRHNCVVIEANK